MKSDIKIPEVKNVTLAVTKSEDSWEKAEWNVHLINRNDYAIENTLVASTGYGEHEGEHQKTSTLRHFLETVPAGGTAIIEPIDPGLFHLNNEYWVSFFVEGKIYDKKFIFLPDSIRTDNLTYIKELEMDGVLHS